MTGLSDIVQAHRAEKEFSSMRGAGRPDRYEVDGKRVPSVTTILGRFKDSGGLMQWANAEGLAGRKLYEDSSAVNIGSFVHRMVEQRLHGEEVSSLHSVQADYHERITSAYSAFDTWFTGGRFKVLATEVPLVSERYHYGGTIDAILIDAEGRYCIGDWKTSNAIYTDYLLQLAAYGQLWNENCPEHLRITGGFHLCRFAKEEGDFTHRFFPALDDELEQFLALRECYERDKLIKKRVK